MEHRNIFSLEQNEIGCIDTAEHVIELLDTKPFSGGSKRTHPRDAGRGCDMPISIPLVQHGSPGAEKGWGSPVLH